LAQYGFEGKESRKRSSCETCPANFGKAIYNFPADLSTASPPWSANSGEAVFRFPSVYAHPALSNTPLSIFKIIQVFFFVLALAGLQVIFENPFVGLACALAIVDSTHAISQMI